MMDKAIKQIINISNGCVENHNCNELIEINNVTEHTLRVIVTRMTSQNEHICALHRNDTDMTHVRTLQQTNCRFF